MTLHALYKPVHLLSQKVRWLLQAADWNYVTECDTLLHLMIHYMITYDLQSPDT